MITTSYIMKKNRIGKRHTLYYYQVEIKNYIAIQWKYYALTVLVTMIPMSVVRMKCPKKLLLWI